MNTREVIEGALYEDQWMYCEACRGVGQVADANFYCHACKGEGCVLEPDQCAAMRDECSGKTDAVLAALSDAGYLVARVTEETKAKAVEAMAEQCVYDPSGMNRASEAEYESWLGFCPPVLDAVLAVLTAEGEA